MKLGQLFALLFLFTTTLSIGQQPPTGNSVALLSTKKGEIKFPHLQTTEGWYHYKLDSPISSNEGITLDITIEQYSYLYLIYSDQLGALADTSFSLSPNMESKVTTKCYLDNNPGTDYLCLLYSKEPLKMNSIIERIKQTNGSFYVKLLNAMPNMLVQQFYDVRYIENYVGFCCRDTNKVVPVIVEILHK